MEPVKFGFAKNGVSVDGISTDMFSSPKVFLKSLPRGGYTAARTANERTSVCSLSFHLKRLVDSRRLLLATDAQMADLEASQTQLEEEAVLLAVKSMKIALQHLEENLAPDDVKEREAMVTVLLTLEAMPNVHAMASLVPRIRESGIVVEVRRFVRSRPIAKDSFWATERERLEKMRLVSVEETILSEDDGSLLEGATSNLFVLMDDGIYTAPGKILQGQLRTTVIDLVCPQLGIPVHLQAPREDQADRYQAAFVTNAYRCLDWVHTIKFPESADRADATFGDVTHPTIVRIRAKLHETLATVSDRPDIGLPP